MPPIGASMSNQQAEIEKLEEHLEVMRESLQYADGQAYYRSKEDIINLQNKINRMKKDAET